MTWIPGLGDSLYSARPEVGPGDPRSPDWSIDDKPIRPIMGSLRMRPVEAIIGVPRHVLKGRVYIVPGGIGDIAWVYAKLLGLGEPFSFAVAGHALDATHSVIALRALPFLNLLPMVKYTSVALCNSEQVYWITVAMDFSNGHMPATPAYIACNRWLEKGQTLDSFLPGLPTQRHFEMRRPKWAIREAGMFVGAKKRAFAIYPSSKDYFGDQNLTLAGWLKIVKSLAERFPEHEIILLGAAWDLSMLIPLYDAVSAIGYSDRVQVVHDRDFATALEILRRCDFFVGAVSGLTIVAEYQRVPTVHFYPKHLYETDHLMGTWESPEMLRDGLSVSLKVGDGAEANIQRMFQEFAPLRGKQ